MAFKKMNPELKTKWLRALRGSKYNQTSHSLKDPTGYCCLGVLCDISKAGKWDGFSYVSEKTKDQNYIPRNLLPQFGITNKTQKRLSVMNDNSRMTFTEIANWVESNL